MTLFEAHLRGEIILMEQPPDIAQLLIAMRREYHAVLNNQSALPARKEPR